MSGSIEMDKARGKPDNNTAKNIGLDGGSSNNNKVKERIKRRRRSSRSLCGLQSNSRAGEGEIDGLVRSLYGIVKDNLKS